MRLCTLAWATATAIVSAPVLEFDFGGESEIHRAIPPFLPHTYTLHPRDARILDLSVFNGPHAREVSRQSHESAPQIYSESRDSPPYRHWTSFDHDQIAYTNQNFTKATLL
jgi:hypothetical protein